MKLCGLFCGKVSLILTIKTILYFIRSRKFFLGSCLRIELDELNSNTVST